MAVVKAIIKEMQKSILQPHYYVDSFHDGRFSKWFLFLNICCFFERLFAQNYSNVESTILLNRFLHVVWNDPIETTSHAISLETCSSSKESFGCIRRFNLINLTIKQFLL